ANLVLWVIDASSPTEPDALPQDLKGKPTIIVANKCDLTPPSFPRRREPKQATDIGISEARLDPGLRRHDEPLNLSAKTGAGLDTLIRAIAAHARKSTEGAINEGVITQARHRRHLSDCHEHLESFLARTTDIELRAEDLRLAADSLGRITGRIDPEDVLDQVFGRFCIGK
ncbi:MAG: hypothetical protein KJ587_06110, partial [Alphaproteobacteria bacterium]|nr:hypothetical protein [Alphaproteobacteria bacterium]